MNEPVFLSVSSNADGDVVHLHANEAGLRLLRDKIDRMLRDTSRDGADHSHFFTRDWGSDDLSKAMLKKDAADGFRVVHCLDVHCWNERWRLEHGLLTDAEVESSTKQKP